MTPTTYRPNSKANVWPIALLAVATVGLLLLMLHTMPLAICAAFAGLMSVIVLAGLNASMRSLLTCGPDAVQYCLPEVTALAFMLHPFRMRRGALPYAAIRGVETRRVLGKFVSTSVCLVQNNQLRTTFAMSAPDDHQWIVDFAADVARRAGVPVVDRGAVSGLRALKW